MYFIDQHCVLVSDTGAGLVPFHLFDYQQDLLQTFLTHRTVIILKARQLGISELVAAYAVWLCQRPEQTVIFLSQGDTEAKNLLNKARIAWEHLPAWLQMPIRDPSKTSTLEWKNGSRILTQPATVRAGRSFNAQLLVFDEWAHQQFQEQIYAAAAPTAISAGNQLIGLSSANGAGNLFHRQWQAAHAGHGMHPVFLPWFVRPGRTQAWYEATTRTMEPWQRAQEYPSVADEAFLLSGRPRFDIPTLLRLMAAAQEPLRSSSAGVTEDDQPLGYLTVWEDPRPDAAYVLGADPAEGLARHDWCAAVVLDQETGLDVATLQGHWAPEEFAARLAALGRQYGDAPLAVERNNHGHAVLLALRALEHYPTIYHAHDYQTADRSPRAGWLTTSVTKPLMIDGLATTFTEGRPWRNHVFLAEAQTYVIRDNGDTGASGRLHDDLVTAYAIAEQVRRLPVTVVGGVEYPDSDPALDDEFSLETWVPGRSIELPVVTPTFPAPLLDFGDAVLS